MRDNIKANTKAFLVAMRAGDWQTAIACMDHPVQKDVLQKVVKETVSQRTTVIVDAIERRIPSGILITIVDKALAQGFSLSIVNECLAWCLLHKRDDLAQGLLQRGASMDAANLHMLSTVSAGTYARHVHEYTRLIYLQAQFENAALRKQIAQKDEELAAVKKTVSGLAKRLGKLEKDQTAYGAPDKGAEVKRLVL